MVPLFDIAVLVALASLDRLSRQTIVIEQCLITPLEGIGAAAGLHGSSQAVGAVQLGHSAEFPESVLQTLAETLEAFGETEGAGFPVGVGQNKVVDHVGKRGALKSDGQLVTVGKIGGT